MNTRARLVRRMGTGLGCVALAVGALTVYNKHDFCRGWARHHAERAAQIRAEAQAPDLSSSERRELRIAAEVHEVVARKYAAVAFRPWRPYPGRPLVTAEERRLAEATP